MGLVGDHSLVVVWHGNIVRCVEWHQRDGDAGSDHSSRCSGVYVEIPLGGRAEDIAGDIHCAAHDHDPLDLFCEEWMISECFGDDRHRSDRVQHDGLG